MKTKETFAGSYIVRVGDINYGGHMGNDKSLLLFHDARLNFLAQHGFSEKDIGGSGLIMSEAHVYFRKEVFRDDELKVYITIKTLKELSFEMHYSIKRDDIEVMSGSTKMVSFDYRNKRVVKIPNFFVAIIKE